MRVTEESVAHCAANAPCLEARILETLGYTANSLRWIEARHRGFISL